MNKLYFTLMTSSVSSALTDAFRSNLQPEIKAIVNNIVMPVIAAILLIVLIVRGVLVWKEYNHGQGEFKWGQLLILFACLVVAISAPSWMWNLIGW